MIVVQVHLHSAITGQRRELARMVIDNLGTGTQASGDYRVRALRGRSQEAFDRAIVRRMPPAAVQREGTVTGHPRMREHIWNLVAKALRSTGYGNVG